MKLVLTCEHAGNFIPEEYRIFFAEKKVLQTHRGYDPGALDLFENLAPLADFQNHNLVSRLLVEVNRSLHHKDLFSEFSGSLSEKQKKGILNSIFLPYRNSVEDAIKNFIAEKEEVLHLSVHSFTPVLDEQVRNADIGLLYDPSRVQEKMLAQRIKKGLIEKNPNYRIRYNYPYLGISDGFTTYLRKIFPEHYSGIELEINQKFVTNNKMPSSLKANLLDVVSNLVK